MHLCTVPSPPRDLKVVTTSGTSVTLRWTAPVVLGDSIVDYSIDYGEPGTVLTTTSTMLEVTGLASNTAFTFHVRARNSVGPSMAATVQGNTTDGIDSVCMCGWVGVFGCGCM